MIKIFDKSKIADYFVVQVFSIMKIEKNDKT